MKKATFFVVGGIVLIVSIFLISFYSWNYFNTRKPKLDLNTLEIVLSDEGNVNLTEQTPLDDSFIRINFKVDKDTVGDSGVLNTIKLGKKHNVAEITKAVFKSLY